MSDTLAFLRAAVRCWITVALILAAGIVWLAPIIAIVALVAIYG